MQANMNEVVHMKIEGPLARLLVKVSPEYQQYLCKERGQDVIYVLLEKALYGTVQAALMFWEDLSSFLVGELGFEPNPYDDCVVNKMIGGKQCTILWHVDDLKISHVDQAVLDEILDRLNDRYCLLYTSDAADD